jgi:DNA replication protein DnaC
LSKYQSNRCLLSNVCNSANTDLCVNICPHLNALHNKGGRHTIANLPSEYALVNLQNSPVRKEQTKIYERLTKYTETFTRQFETNADRIKSIYCWSSAPGTGKTTTASALLNSYLVTHYIGSLQRGLTPATRPVYFLDVNEWQSIYNEFNRPRVPDHIAEPAAARYYRMLDYAKSAEFAVLDDVGVRDCTEGFRGDLHSVVNYRVTNGLPTVYTSNLPLAELPSVFGEQRLYDRIRDQTIEFLFEGTSKRGLRK